MNDSIFAEIEDRAHIIVGREAWLRSNDDPDVEKSVNNAIIFLCKINKKLRRPYVTGGTTANPETVLTLYWRINNAIRLMELYVSFLLNGTCRISWIEPNGASKQVEDLSLLETINFDVPKKVRDLRRDASKFTDDKFRRFNAHF
jgi:hypothetical protein